MTMREMSIIGITFILAACGYLQDRPIAEQKALLCAQNTLSTTPGVSNVEIQFPLSASRGAIVHYNYIDNSGESVHSRMMIDGWAPPGKPISYYYELIDEDFMTSSRAKYDIRDLMFKCDLGMSVIVD